MILVSGVVLFVILSELILSIYILFLRAEKPQASSTTSISILVPARNEEKTVEVTIQSLLNQETSDARVEILVGDDSSSDKTGEIVELLSRMDKRVRYFLVQENEKLIGGKAGVLDYLIKHATGEVVLVADADMKYPKNWALSMSKFILKGKLVSSFTKVEGKSVWSQWQNLDWLINLSGVRMLSFFGFNLTAIGNNMGFPVDAYERIPGFSKMKGFITEDLELLNQMKHAGIDQKLVFSPDTLGATRPAETGSMLISQRMRWMSGAFTSPFWLILGWIIRVALLPLVIGLTFFDLQAALLLYSIHWILQSIILLTVLIKLRIRTNAFSFITFDFFYLFLNLVCLYHYLANKEIRWKDRDYLKKKLKLTEG